MSLPLIFSKTLGAAGRENDTVAIPEAMPYLFLPQDTNSSQDTNPSMVAQLQVRDAAEFHLNIGVAWSGNRAHVRDKFRSISPGLLKPLPLIEGCHFHSLQLEKLPQEFTCSVTDHSDSLQDLYDTAKLIQQLDLIISVDTAVAHLAGALAKPVWTLLPFWPDWRWGLDRQDSPWYPTMRLFRQQKPGQWQDVIEQARTALRQYMQPRARS
jgi:hypothetical protein